MAQISFKQFRVVLVLIVLSSFLVSCTSSANSKYFGQTAAPSDNVLRYITGSEPESLDPQFVTGQPEARIMMALWDGLVEYHPKTMEPIPAIAERWELSPDGTEYIFYLRKNAKFSNGDAITAKDFVYSFRRGLSPELASRNANLAYYIKYAEGYNANRAFVKNADGSFLLKADLEEKKEGEAPKTVAEVKPDNFGAQTEFHKYIDSPERATVSSDPFTLAREIEPSAKLKEVFKFYPKDLKNASGFANKVKNGQDKFSQFLRQNINQAALDACAGATCDDANKQLIADDLNKLLAGDSLFNQQPQLSENAQKLQKKLADENKKREDANAKIDEEVAKLTDEAKKQEKLKAKKKPIEKLFYANRYVLEETFGEEVEKAPIVDVKAEDIGIEAIDDYTVRLKLYQSAPFFLGLLAHQFFRVLHEPSITKFGKNWLKPENIVTSGAFKVSVYKPYDELVVVKDPNNWDAANVRLDGIEFYPLDEQTTMQNLYKAGKVDATYNHTVPAAWNEVVREFKSEYSLHPEVAVEYYSLSVKKPPMDNIKVRQALALAIDRDALAKFRKTIKPLVDFTPQGIFPKYEEARTKVYTELLKKDGSSLEEWKARKFDAEKARKTLAEAGYPVQGAQGSFSCPTFPGDKVNITYNTAESNQKVAEFIQAQWKQNLGINVSLKNMEFKTFLPYRSAVEYEGAVRNGWVGDYMDPFTFLNLFYSPQNDGATGWYDPEYDKLLDAANQEIDEMKRYEMLAAAEYYVMKQQIVIPLGVPGTSWMKKPYVKGMYPNPGTLHPWKFVYIERDTNKWTDNMEAIMDEKDPAVEAQINQLTATQVQTQKPATTGTETKTTAKVE
jgi:oligopeptide transport system substrate-binding protein